MKLRVRKLFYLAMILILVSHYPVVMAQYPSNEVLSEQDIQALTKTLDFIEGLNLPFSIWVKYKQALSQNISNTQVNLIMSSMKSTIGMAMPKQSVACEMALKLVPDLGRKLSAHYNVEFNQSDVNTWLNFYFTQETQIKLFGQYAVTVLPGCLPLSSVIMKDTPVQRLVASKQPLQTSATGNIAGDDNTSPAEIRAKLAKKYHHNIWKFFNVGCDELRYVPDLLNNSEVTIPPYFDINPVVVYGADPNNSQVVLDQCRPRLKYTLPALRSFAGEMYPSLPDSNSTDSIRDYIPPYLLDQK